MPEPKEDAAYYEAVGRYVCKYGVDASYADVVYVYRGPDEGDVSDFEDLIAREASRASQAEGNRG